ncbi:hypothetical protein K435DRAFT_847388 [Dendrothele bispora CBS 962.96]|uniref:Uncharacterized protein n=1 Tax=Dendrothele bispora (strain CBS 962.96) TaxID=1314807 RepID=A0A4S8MYK2_DENBC|nr:hypothetical protein K435DRAFT_847388 [Dendrothele bispora CBS 962.96]
MANLPPPAYSEQEFDRKTATAIEVSISTNRQEQERQEEEWEEWDETKFLEAEEARTEREQPLRLNSGPSAVRALPSLPSTQVSTSSTPSNGSRPTTRQQTPPRVDKQKSIKKSKATLTQSTKPRPSWYEEAGLGDSISSAASSASSSVGVRYSGSSVTSSSSSDNRHGPRLMVHNLTSQDEEDDYDDLAPPPFTPTVPLPNGPVGSVNGIPVGDVITLSYNGRSNPNHISRLGPPPGSPPPSSRLSPIPAPRPALGASMSTAPLPSRPVLQVEPIARPRSTSTVRTTSTYDSGAPIRMNFDSSLAYNKNETLSRVIEKQQPSPATPLNPLSLYNSSVSAALSPPSQSFNRPQIVPRGNQSQGNQSMPFAACLSPPKSPRPMYAANTPPPNVNATQFPLRPAFSTTSLDNGPYGYQSRWASSEQQFTQFG